jgi:hypothetical protein
MRMSALVKSLLIAAAVIVAMPARGVVAQSTLTTGGPNSAGRTETRKAPSDNPKADGARSDAESRSIYMVIQTDSAMTQEELRDKFEEARKASPECSIESYDINPIDQATYVLLKSIVQSGVIPKNPASEGPVKVEPVKGKDGEWTIILEGATKYLELAKIRVASPGGPEEEITMKPEPKNKANADLRYNSPGEYILKLPAGRNGKSATFEVTDDAKGGKPAEVSLEFTWPDTGRCYLVKLNGVQGDEKALYDTLKDGKKISNPVKGLEEAKKAAIVVASFKEMLAVPLVFQVDAIKLTFPKPGGGVEPKRMWMRFPLTKAEAAALSKELDGKFVGDGFKTVPAWIRQNLLGEKLTPEGSTGWFELPWDADNQAFEKTLPIDTKSWQQRLVNNKEYMGDNAILIYEFEGEDGSQRIIKGDNGKYYRSEPVGGWLTGLPTAPTADK